MTTAPREWNFDEDLGGTFALDVPMADRLRALEEDDAPTK